MSVKKKVRTPNDENRLDALIQRLVSMWLSQQTEQSALSANQRSQFVAWVGADAEREGASIARRQAAQDDAPSCPTIGARGLVVRRTARDLRKVKNNQ
jgi:hypothetical protein